MQYRTIGTDDIDELFSWQTGWDQQFLQLSAGPLGFQTRQVDLPGVLIEWNCYGQSVLFREVLREPALVFGLVLDSTGPTKYRGREMATNEAAVLHPGHEQEYVVRPGCKSLVVHVAPPLARTLVWGLGSQRLNRVPRRLIHQLVKACRSATTLAMRSEASTSVPETDEAIRDRVIVALRDALAPWIAGDDGANRTADNPPREFRVVKQAEQLMAQWDPARKLDVGQLAAELEVSQRALYEAFRRWLGMGPYEFHLLQKMHEFRAALVDGESYHGKVKQAALATGFRHLGRLTQSYRRHFAESPRETMKRRESRRS